MSTAQTFYLSRILGNKIYSGTGDVIGRVKDIIVDRSSERPKVIAILTKVGRELKTLDFSHWQITKTNGQYLVKCNEVKETTLPEDNIVFLAKHMLDKQIVDMDGRKVVRVNDLRLAVVSTGAYVVAVDVGMEGLLRRIGIAKTVKQALKLFGVSIPSNFVIWEDIQTIHFPKLDIQLSTTYSKLHTLHPSDLADIIEDLDRQSQIAIFSTLDEESAADVLEELEPDARVQVIESMTVEKAADVLEKMPADEVADLLDELEDEKAEELLSEMETEASQEVRDLMEYSDNEVGSQMSTDFLAFSEDITVSEVINELRRLKPENNMIYSLYIVDSKERLIATVSLRDIIVSEPETKLSQVMSRKLVFVYDDDKTKPLAELFTKYNLLALPVVDEKMNIMGSVVIDDVMYELMN